MAIRKNNSRNSDRVTIKKMHAQGFSIQQIESKLSITPEHINYVLTQYETDLVTSKAKQKELDAFRAAEKLVHDKARIDPTVPDLTALRETIKAELLAEMRPAELLAEKAPVVETLPEPAVEAEITEFEPVVTTEEEEVTPRRRKRTA